MKNIVKLDFSYQENITVISKEQFDAHIKLYEGYVDKVNEVSLQLTQSSQNSKGNTTYSQYRGLKKGETFALNGVILHELYFSNLGGRQTAPKPLTTNFLEEHFGGFSRWQDDFINCANSARGWCILGFEQRTSTFRNIVMDYHDQGFVVGFFPVLVLDMYEHAYFLDYATDKASYIHYFLDNVNWSIVEKRISLLEGN